MKGIDPSLRGGFFWVDCRFIVEGSFIEIDEVRGSPLSPGRAVPGVMSHLSAFETSIIVGSWCGLGDTVSRRSPLPPPLVRGPSAAEVHGNWSIVKGRRGC